MWKWRFEINRRDEFTHAWNWELPYRAKKRERGVEYNVREYDGGDPGRKVSLHSINAE